MSIISRRNFFRSILALSASALGFMAFKSTMYPSKIIKTNTKMQLNINDLTDGIKFVDEIIISKTNDNINIFSARCPHLGCKINNLEGNVIICPCHGSKYNPEGKLISGPSKNNLTKLNFSIKNDMIIIENENEV